MAKGNEQPAVLQGTSQNQATSSSHPAALHCWTVHRTRLFPYKVRAIQPPHTGGGALRLPVALAQGVQAKLIRNFCSVHGVRQILLVGEYQENRITKLVLQRQKRNCSVRCMITGRVGMALQATRQYETATIQLRNTQEQRRYVAAHCNLNC